MPAILLFIGPLVKLSVCICNVFNCATIHKVRSQNILKQVRKNVMQRQSLSQLDHSFVAMLYQRHAATILLYVRRRVFSWEDAEDIVLEVFLAALEQENKLSMLADTGQLAWLRRVAHNKVIDL